MTKRRTRLDIRGMSCANCSRTITTALRDLDGVSDVAINVATDEGTIEYDPAKVTLADIQEAIDAAGYDISTSRVTITIADMTCANCAETIGSALDSVPGVIRADVNYATDEAQVEYNPEAVTVDELHEAIEQSGYTPVQGGRQGTASDGRVTARNHEIEKQLRLTLFGAALAAPLILILAEKTLLGGILFGETLVGIDIGWIEFLLATPVQAVLGWQFYRSASTALLRNRTANMDVLIALGSSTAYGYSIAVLTGILAGGLYFDTAALILVFITLGNYLEARSKGRASEAIRSLLELEPETATIIDGGRERSIPLEEVQVGDRLKIRPGERVPTDGVVVDGRSAVDESMVTGESVPVEKSIGDDVVGSTMNENGVLVIEASRVGADTALQQIVRTVRDAQSRQPAIQNFADRISAVFVPIVILNALLWTAAWYLFPGPLVAMIEVLPVWGLVGGGPAVLSTFEFAVIVFASAVLIACPCALGLATPAATMVGTTIGARNGILFKGGDVLERTRDIDTVVFDKTGTLTEGEMRLTDVVSVGDAGSIPDGDGPFTDGGNLVSHGKLDEENILWLAASAESGSEHPLARAVVGGASERDVEFGDATDFENLPGHGVRATVDGREVLVGNRKLLADNGVDPELASGELDRMEDEGKTTVLVSYDGQLVGILGVADTVKRSAQRTIDALRDRGIEVLMLTGDTERTAAVIADRLGIEPTDVRSGVRPEDKSAVVESIQDGDRSVMMVGDGVNDAPALAVASVGCAIGSGTDVAIETADVTLMRDDPFDVVKAIRISDATLRKIKQNLGWALGYNTAMIPLASLGLLQPVFAAGAMAFSSVSVLANSLAFRRYDPTRESPGLRSLWASGRETLRRTID